MIKIKKLLLFCIFLSLFLFVFSFNVLNDKDISYEKLEESINQEIINEDSFLIQYKSFEKGYIKIDIKTPYFENEAFKIDIENLEKKLLKEQLEEKNMPINIFNKYEIKNISKLLKTVEIKYFNGDILLESFYFLIDNDNNLVSIKNIIIDDNIDLFNNIDDENYLLIQKENLIIKDTKKANIFLLEEVRKYLKPNYFKLKISLTFDDGPSIYTNDILDILEKYNADATFFVLGKKSKENSDILINIVERGHELGNHSWNHENLSKLNKKELNKNITKTNSTIKEIINVEMNLIRPPYGSFNDKLIDFSFENNFEIALWNIDSLDWKLRDSKKIYNEVIKNSKHNGVILMHDIYFENIEALENILLELGDDYEFVKYSEIK